MNKSNAAKRIALGSAMLQGKTIQRLDKREWVDVFNLNTISYDPESYRVKPKEFKNFALPWEYIGKEWNFATWNHISKTMILYGKHPKYAEGEGWFCDHATLACGLVPNEEGITEENGLARSFTYASKSMFIFYP